MAPFPPTMGSLCSWVSCSLKPQLEIAPWLWRYGRGSLAGQSCLSWSLMLHLAVHEQEGQEEGKRRDTNNKGKDMGH